MLASLNLFQWSDIVQCCKMCGESKPLTQEFWKYRTIRGKFHWVLSACRKCTCAKYLESNRKSRHKRVGTEEGRAAIAAVVRARRALKPRDSEKRREEERRRTQRKAEQEGREYIPLIVHQAFAYPDQKIRNARIAFRKFIDESSDEEVKCWYAAIGKPWWNPRLIAAEKDKVRHQFDNEYHIKRRLYYRDRKTQRRFDVVARNDGTLSPQIIKQATKCLYCGAVFDPTCKATLDHLISIKKGGSHSAANVVVSCRTCNSRKGSLDYLDWIESLDESHRTRALRTWRKLRGAPPQQQELFG